MKSQLNMITALKKFNLQKGKCSTGYSQTWVSRLTLLSMWYNSSLNILYGSKRRDLIKFHLSVCQSKFCRQCVRGAAGGISHKDFILVASARSD